MVSHAEERGGSTLYGRKCPACEWFCPSSAVSCPECGTVLAGEERVLGVACPAPGCGHLNPVGAGACLRCHTALPSRNPRGQPGKGVPREIPEPARRPAVPLTLGDESPAALGRHENQGTIDQPPIDHPGYSFPPFKVADAMCVTSQDLARALAIQWEEGKLKLERGVILEWAEKHKKDYELVAILHDLQSDSRLDADLRLFSLITHLDPTLPPSFLGYSISPEDLAPLAHEALGGNPDSQRVIQGLFEGQVLSRYARASKRREFARLDEAWQSSVREYDEASSTIPVPADARPTRNDVVAQLLLGVVSPGFTSQQREAAVKAWTADVQRVEWFKAIGLPTRVGLSRLVLLRALAPIAQQEVRIADEERQREANSRRSAITRRLAPSALVVAVLVGIYYLTTTGLAPVTGPQSMSAPAAQQQKSPEPARRAAENAEARQPAEQAAVAAQRHAAAQAESRRRAEEEKERLRLQQAEQATVAAQRHAAGQAEARRRAEEEGERRRLQQAEEAKRRAERFAAARAVFDQARSEADRDFQLTESGARVKLQEEEAEARRQYQQEEAVARKQLEQAKSVAQLTLQAAQALGQRVPGVTAAAQSNYQRSIAEADANFNSAIAAARANHDVANARGRRGYEATVSEARARHQTALANAQMKLEIARQ